MGSDAHDNRLFLPFASALYSDDDNDTHAFTSLLLDGSSDDCDDGDSNSELVPLLELVSAEDVERVYTQAVDANASSSMYNSAHGLPSTYDYHNHNSASLGSDFGFDPALPELQQQQQQMLQQPATALSASTATASEALPPALQPPNDRYLTRKELSGKKPFKTKANKARDERRSELIYLRNKVAELETQLGSIQTKRPRLEQQQRAAPESPETSSMSLAVRPQPTAAIVQQSQQQHPLPPPPRPHYITNAWADIASRQSDERIKSERENIRLRLVLENQLKIAKSLERMLHKKSTAKDMEEFAERKHGNSTASSTPADASDADVFNALLREVEQLYHEIDAVFDANGLAHSETPVTNARVRTDATSGMILEMCATKVLPFDVHATGTAVWHHCSFAKAHTPFRCYTYSSSKYLHAPEDTVMEAFVLKLDAKGTDAYFRVKQVMQRHVESDRVVVLWRAAFEAFEFAAEPVTGMRFSESGFILIKRPRAIAAAGSTTTTHSLVQTCYVMTPDFVDDVNHPRVGAITDFVLASTATNISSTHQMIENVLLEQAVMARQRNSSSSSRSNGAMQVLL